MDSFGAQKMRLISIAVLFVSMTRLVWRLNSRCSASFFQLETKRERSGMNRFSIGRAIWCVRL